VSSDSIEPLGTVHRAPPTLLPRTLLATGTADGYVTLDGPLGAMYVAFNPHGVSCVTLVGEHDDFEAYVGTRLGRRAYPVVAAPPRLARALERSLATGRSGSLPVDLRSVTPFQQQVLRKATEIPPGEVRPYGWVAREIGSPGATRAVGTALARNPVPFFVPCHRVVRTGGALGAYSLGGPENKRRLLVAEGAIKP
jgi:O-6-methylguanine DNA methyltransferase